MNNTGLEQGLQQELAQLQNVYDLITEFLVQYSFQLIGALLIFLLGLWLAAKVAGIVNKQLEKYRVDITLASFVTHLVRILIIIMVAIVALGKLGISVTPMVAAIGAASLGAGLAIQGMLSNYAAGITIIVTRPFAVGNTISVRGVTGVVKDILLGMTILTNEEGEQISIPNKHIVGEILHNSFEYKLVESQFNICYDQDADAVIALVNKALLGSGKLHAEQPPQVGINGFNNLGIEIGLRYWLPTQSYFQDKYITHQAIHGALKAAAIKIPSLSRDAHLLGE